MGTRGHRYFEEAGKLGGLVAKMRLASVAQVTSTEATTMNDSAELLTKLEAAFNRIRTEFAAPQAQSRSAPVTALSAPEVARPGDTSELPRRCMTAVAELIAQRSLFVGDLGATVRRITEAASDTLDIERVSVWFLDPARTQIACADLFERAKAQHSSGTTLFAKDFAPYFQALASERTIAAHDAHTDPRTRVFSEVYLKPLGIGAMLDVPILASGNMVGVICHEHVGSQRRWSTDDETFAYVLASLVALTVEQRTRSSRT
jgi:hypothetical protein